MDLARNTVAKSTASELQPDVDAQMFDLAPVPLWLEDYSGIKQLLDRWRGQGVTNLREFLSADPGRVRASSDRIRVLKVNTRTLGLYRGKGPVRSRIEP